MIDTEAIRDAFAALADEAPPPDRITATLATRARRARQRRLVLRVAGAGAAAATTGLAGAGVWRLTRPSGYDFPVLPAGPGGGWLEVPLRFRPGWLPHRYGESVRSMVVTGDRVRAVARDWQRGETAGDGTRDVVSLVVGWHPALLFADRPSGPIATVDVNGVPGQLVRADADQAVSTYLTWQPPGQPQLIVTTRTGEDADAQADVAQRVARSVRPDPGSTWLGPRFGWLPPDLATAPWRVEQAYEGTRWIQGVGVYDPVANGRNLLVVIGPGVHQGLLDPATAQPVRVRGLDAWLSRGACPDASGSTSGPGCGTPAPGDNRIFLRLPDGVEAFGELESGDERTSELIRTLEEFDFGPWPDMSWVGGR